MTVRTATAEDLVEEVVLFGRTLRTVLGNDHETGLPPALLGVLLVLANTAPCRQNELAVSLCISQSSLSRQITELVDAGLVERRPDPEDGRAALVQVSESGRALLADHRQRRAARLLTTFADWSQDDAEQALVALRRLKTTFAGMTAPPVTVGSAARHGNTTRHEEGHGA